MKLDDTFVLNNNKKHIQQDENNHTLFNLFLARNQPKRTSPDEATISLQNHRDVD